METQFKKLVFLKSRLSEVRCGRCGRLLFRGIAQDVEIKCPRCGMMQLVGGRKPGAKTGCHDRCRNEG